MRLDLRVDLGPRAVAAGDDRGAAGEAEVGRRKRPAVAGAGQDGGLVEDQRLALDPAAAGQPDACRA